MQSTRKSGIKRRVFLLGICVSTGGLINSFSRQLGDQMAASTHDIVVVGCEAFALLEECLVRKPRPPLHQSSHHHRLHDQLPSVTTTPVLKHTKEGINSSQAALMYGGVSIVDYRNRKPLPSFRKV